MPETSTNATIRAIVLEQVGEGVIIADATGHITFVNDAAKRLHGVAELGVGVENWSQTYHLLTMEGEPYPTEELPLAHALFQRETVANALWRVRRPDGSEVVAQGTATPLADGSGTPLGAVLVVRDVTLERATAQTLAERDRLERDRLSDIFMRAPAFMAALHGPNHVFEIVNPAFYKLLGHRRDIIGKPVADALPEVAEQGFIGLLDQVYHTGKPFIGKDVAMLLQREINSALEERFLDFTYQPLFDPDGTVSGVLAHGVDLTERKHLEQEREQLLEELRDAAARQRQFLREMLLGFTEGKLWLCDHEGELPPPLPFGLDTVGLNPGSMRRLRKQAEAVARELHLSLDRWQDLETAIGEAAMNAVRHAGGGEGRVYADTSTGTIQVWVRDAGPGIAEELIHRAVERNWTTGGFGQGFWLMLKTCDRLYLLTNAEGTTIVLEQERQAPEPAWLAQLV